MNLYLRFILLVTVMLGGGGISSAQAATIFTDSTAFEVAAGGSTLLDDFNDFTGNDLVFFPTVTDRGPYQITRIGLRNAVGGLGGNLALNLNGTGYMSMLLSVTGNAIRFDLDSPVSAISFDHESTVSDDIDITAGGDVAVIPTGPTPRFAGIVFDTPVSSFSFTGPISDRTFQIDNLRTVGAPIPEPTTASMALVGIGTLLLRRQSRARTCRV